VAKEVGVGKNEKCLLIVWFPYLRYGKSPTLKVIVFGSVADADTSRWWSKICSRGETTLQAALRGCHIQSSMKLLVSF
jgi:hypothetical protein